MRKFIPSFRKLNVVEGITKKGQGYNIASLYGKRRHVHLPSPFFVLISGYTKGVWLGYSDIQKEGRYVSMSNAEELGYQNWYKTEPNNFGGNEHCAAIHFQYVGWVDYHCTAKFNYVCKK